MIEKNEDQILADERKLEDCCGGGPKEVEEVEVEVEEDEEA
jgi:hypothetical protein